MVNESDDGNVIEESVLQTLMEGVGPGINRIVDLYLKVAPERLTAIKDAINDKDYPTLTNQAHSLKGASRQFGANMLAEVAYEIEKKGRVQEVNGLDELTEQLAIETEKVVNNLNKRFNKV